MRDMRAGGTGLYIGRTVGAGVAIVKQMVVVKQDRANTADGR
jgi:hypothetical protein